MHSEGLNYWAILVAGAVYFLIGAFWYAKPIFGKAWMDGIGKTEEQLKAQFSPWKLVWAFIGSIIASYGIARILSWTPVPNSGSGLITGLLAGVCFVFAAMTINDVMESRPTKLTAVNCFYHIIGFAVAGLIIGAWR